MVSIWQFKFIMKQKISYTGLLFAICYTNMKYIKQCLIKIELNRLQQTTTEIGQIGLIFAICNTNMIYIKHVLKKISNSRCRGGVVIYKTTYQNKVQNKKVFKKHIIFWIWHFNLFGYQIWYIDHFNNPNVKGIGCLFVS